MDPDCSMNLLPRLKVKYAWEVETQTGYSTTGSQDQSAAAAEYHVIPVCVVSMQADSAARKRMAHRSFQLRETLVHAKSEVRQHRHTVRQQSHHIDKVQHDKAKALQQQTLEFDQREGQAVQLTHEKVCTCILLNQL